MAAKRQSVAERGGRRDRSAQAKQAARSGVISSPWQRQLRDRRAIYMRVHERLPWLTIATRDGRTVRVLERIVKDYLENIEAGELLPSPLQADALDLASAALERLGMLRDTAIELVMHAENENAASGALRTWLRAESQYVELLQAVGRLPRELRVLATMTEVREIAANLNRWLAELEAGEITPQQLRAQMDELAGVKMPAIDAAEDEPVADAEIVT